MKKRESSVSTARRNIMKFLCFGTLCLVLLCGRPLLAQVVKSQNISANFNKKNLKEILVSLQEKSGYQFVYNDALIARYKDISISLNKEAIDQSLNRILGNTGLSFTKQGNKIIISERAKQEITQTLKGKVVDENGGPMPGATVQILELKRTVVANNDGDFEVKVPLGTYAIEASFMSYHPRKVSGIKVDKAKAVELKIELIPQVNALNEVVVTALGIKREEKALGFAITTVQGEQLTEALSNNWTDALSGKVAGLNLLRSNAGPAGSNRIILRGENSLSGNTEALIVIDGVIVSGSSGRATGNGSAYMGDDSPSDYGTSVNDINPADIESVSVLKGPGATALYGARGSGGAIIITTKLADPKVKGIGITFSSNAAFEQTSRWPDYQNEYGQGDEGVDYYSYGDTEDGSSQRGTSNAWGARFDGQSFYQYNPNSNSGATVRTPWVAYPNNKKDFFETGSTFTNNISLEGGNKATSARLSYTNLNNTWIIPNTGYERNTVSFNVNQKITSKLTVASKVSYTNRFSDNLPSAGYNNQTIMYWMARAVPSADIDWYKGYWVPGFEGSSQVTPFSSNFDNPYTITYEMLNKQTRNNVTGNINATYNFTSDLSLMVRTSMDMMYDKRSQQRPKDTRKFRDGMYRTQNIFTQELTTDFFLKYKKSISEKFDIDLTLGGSTLKNKYIRDEIRADRLFAPGIFNFANSMDVPLAYQTLSNYGVSSAFALASIAYDNFLFLDLTGRRDWSSTLVTLNSTSVRPFDYPSANLSFILSEKLKLPKAFSFVKLRASYAEVGNGGTTPYLTSYVYNSETTFPSGLTNPNSLANPNLLPERSKSIEFGADIRMFKNKLNLDVTVYQNNTDKQILNVPVDRASGYSTAVLNSGEVQNRGLEISGNANIIQGKRNGFAWKMFATFTANRNKVLSLADSVETIILQTGPGSRGFVEARVGGSMGDMYGLGYERSPDGQIVYENGYPVKTLESKFLGNVYPKGKWSVGNEFRYKQFRLNVLFDGQFGGKAYSHTHANLAQGGKLTKTLPGRYNGIIGNGVIANGDGTYRKNDVIAPEIWTYYLEHFNPDNIEGNLFKTDFIKFREARLDYTFSNKLVKSLKLQKASIGIWGRDLLIFSKWPSFDPEFGTLSDGMIRSGFEIGQFPATRTFGVNLNVSF
ncbi:SusC/RagA family TonB-linked outer membrane protein [Pedobacter xixiisoli]|uniref:TonB-linked outer membrane protein, SusC/RagA family n=1 Tax=Pedobacter xixiisoli TaxID=1476464 RepID=A0A286A8Q8_9SPHI|nr:SusC/RagA family TonB-linked outer membrane protein [Pedobacter xixiisoli]SOD18298.1 TonB-linked outer membrane protein, SusC/RagA family [Pedobacter xixiisoli]